MEDRKKKEIAHYNNRISDFKNSNYFIISSLNFLKNYFIKNLKDRKVLDFGCGNGIHSYWLSDYSKKVIGIDLSDKSLDIARERVKKAEFLEMDCENLDFDNESFDIVFDGGTFSSLDINKSIEEIIRVLKKDGVLIGIETLGHNPILNFKRKINKIIGKRTVWAQSHIFKMSDYEEIKRRFRESEAYFFHIIAWISFPFLNLQVGRFMLKWLEKVDSLLLYIFPFLKKYSFKIVFIFKGPFK